MVKRGGDTASFTSPEPVVINNFEAKTGAWVSAEKLLTQLAADSVLFIEFTPNPL
jgi:hypothetical protein